MSRTSMIQVATSAPRLRTLAYLTGSLAAWPTSEQPAACGARRHQFRPSSQQWHPFYLDSSSDLWQHHIYHTFNTTFSSQFLNRNCTSCDFKYVFHHQVVHPFQHRVFLFWFAFTFLNLFQITWLPSRFATAFISSKYLWKPRVLRQASSYQRLASDNNLQGNVIDLYISEV